MRIRQHSFTKPNEWKDFIRDMDLWIMVYDALTFLAKQKIMGVMALKAHIQNSEIAYSKLLNTRELTFFKEILAAKTKDYDPDKQLEVLNDQVVCVELNPKSKLIKNLGTSSICGKFLGMNKGKAIASILNDEGNVYEEKEAAFSFCLAYPDADSSVQISLLDLVNLEPFI